MTHDHHETLPGYSAGQIFYDGCAECEARATLPDRGVDSIDLPTFARAWGRAAQMRTHGLADCSRAEYHLLLTLWSVQWQLKQLGLYVEPQYDLADGGHFRFAPGAVKPEDE